MNIFDIFKVLHFDVSTWFSLAWQARLNRTRLARPTKRPHLSVVSLLKNRYRLLPAGCFATGLLSQQHRNEIMRPFLKPVKSIESDLLLARCLDTRVNPDIFVNCQARNLNTTFAICATTL